MTHRELYIAIRAAVLAILAAFDKYYEVGKNKKSDIMPNE